LSLSKKAVHHDVVVSLLACNCDSQFVQANG